MQKTKQSGRQEARDSGDRILDRGASRRTVYVCGFAVALILTNSAHAQYESWIQPAGGSWENGADWSLGVNPSGHYGAEFNLSTALPYTVTMSANELAGATVQNSQVVINATGGHSLTGYSFNVNSSAGQVASLTFNGTVPYGTDGTQIVANDGIGATTLPGSVGGGGTSYLTINDAYFAVGPNAYNCGIGSVVAFNNVNSGADGALNFNGMASMNQSSFIIGGGLYGDGLSVTGTGNTPASLNISNDSVVQMFGDIEIGSTYLYGAYGAGPSGTGVVNVTASKVSEFSTAMPALFLGYSSGNGTLNISNGSLVSLGQFVVGQSPGIGNLHVFGTGSSANASNSILVGSGSTLQVNAGGTVTAAALNLSSGSTMAIGLDEGGIAITGLATLAGTLDVTLSSIPDPTLGETFDLITFGSETGTFSTIDLPPLDPGLAWNTQQLYINGEISVVSAVPEPASLSLLAIGSIALLGRRRKMSTEGAS